MTSRIEPSSAVGRRRLAGRSGQYDAVMNRIEFIVATDDEPRLEIKVDDVALEEHARRAELRSARADRQERLAGAYRGLTHCDAVSWPSRHFLGAPALPGAGDTETVLLGCDCGDWGCRPLFAKVHFAATCVTWREFRDGHRPAWDLSGLGPFEFDRGRYESALRTTQRVLHRRIGGRQRNRPRPGGLGLFLLLQASSRPMGTCTRRPRSRPA